MSEKEISLGVTFKTAVDFHTKGKINDAKNLYDRSTRRVEPPEAAIR